MSKGINPKKIALDYKAFAINECYEKTFGQRHYSYKELKKSFHRFLADEDNSYPISFSQNFYHIYRSLKAFLIPLYLFILSVSLGTLNTFTSAIFAFFVMSFILFFVTLVDFLANTFSLKRDYFLEVVPFVDYKKSLFLKEYRERMKELENEEGGGYEVDDILKDISLEAYASIFKIFKKGTDGKKVEIPIEKGLFGKEEVNDIEEKPRPKRYEFYPVNSKNMDRYLALLQNSKKFK